MWSGSKILLNDNILEIRQEDTGGIWIHHKLNESYIYLTRDDYEVIRQNYKYTRER